MNGNDWKVLLGRIRAEYGVGFSRQNSFHITRFAEVSSEETKLLELAGYLGWSHFKELLYLEDPLQRDFYGEMSRLRRWSVQTLGERVKGILYERTAISRKPEVTIRAHWRLCASRTGSLPTCCCEILIYRTNWVLRIRPASGILTGDSA